MEDFKLTPKQRTGAEVLAEDPSMKDYELAAAVGVTPQAVCRWRKKEEWNQYYEQCLKDVWKKYGQKAQKLMWDKALDGEYRAIEYVCNSAGLKPNDKLDVNADGLIIKVSVDGD